MRYYIKLYWIGKLPNMELLISIYNRIAHI